jgi:hypothetical protein
LAFISSNLTRQPKSPAVWPVALDGVGRVFERDARTSRPAWSARGARSMKLPHTHGRVDRSAGRGVAGDLSEGEEPDLEGP